MTWNIVSLSGSVLEWFLHLPQVTPTGVNAARNLWPDTGRYFRLYMINWFESLPWKWNNIHFDVFQDILRLVMRRLVHSNSIFHHTAHQARDSFHLCLCLFFCVSYLSFFLSFFFSFILSFFLSFFRFFYLYFYLSNMPSTISYGKFTHIDVPKVFTISGRGATLNGFTSYFTYSLQNSMILKSLPPTMQSVTLLTVIQTDYA